MLNASLTVRASSRLSSKEGLGELHRRRHPNTGKQRKGLVFLLWERTQEKERLIARTPDISYSKSPSFGSLRTQGFLRLQHFSQANNFIEKNGGVPIDWQIVWWSSRLVGV